MNCLLPGQTYFMWSILILMVPYTTSLGPPLIHSSVPWRKLCLFCLPYNNSNENFCPNCRGKPRGLSREVWDDKLRFAHSKTYLCSIGSTIICTVFSSFLWTHQLIIIIKISSQLAYWLYMIYLIYYHRHA